MKYTFYRPSEVNIPEFNRIVDNLKRDAEALINSGSDIPVGLSDYIRQLIRDARQDPEKQGKYHWGLQDLQKLRAQSCVDYFYNPTYYALAILTCTAVHYPELTNDISDYEDILRGAMETASVINFKGYGYNFGFDEVKNMKLFAHAGCAEYLRSNKNFCPEFRNLFFAIAEDYRTMLESGVSGSLSDGWKQRGIDLTEDFKDITEMIFYQPSRKLSLLE